MNANLQRAVIHHCLRLLGIACPNLTWGVAAVLAAASLLGGCASDNSVKSLADSTNAAILGHPERLSRNAEVRSYVNALAQDVLTAAKQNRTIDAAKDTWVYQKFEAQVVLDPVLNAFVTGADQVYVHSGLIAALERPEQLVAVLTHELSHNEKRHLKGKIDARTRSTLAKIAVIGGRIVGGTAGGGVSAGGAVAGAANQLLSTSFNRKDELEADSSGLDLYMKMGLDPVQFSRVFEILKEKYGEGGGGDHPTNSERVAQVKKLAGAGQATYRTLDADAFARIQALVKIEQAGMTGTTVMQDKALRAGLMSCFDYCTAPCDAKSRK